MDILREKLKNTGSCELPDNHQERFESKLESYYGSTNKNYLFIFSLTVSVAVITILIVLFFNNPVTINNKTNDIILTSESYELKETEQYFRSQIKFRLNQINSLKINKEQKTIINDLKDLDNALLKLKSDYKKTPGDERIVNAVLNTYLIKIEALDNIMNILKKYS